MHTRTFGESVLAADVIAFVKRALAEDDLQRKLTWADAVCQMNNHVIYLFLVPLSLAFSQSVHHPHERLEAYLNISHRFPRHRQVQIFWHALKLNNHVQTIWTWTVNIILHPYITHTCKKMTFDKRSCTRLAVKELQNVNL